MSNIGTLITTNIRNNFSTKSAIVIWYGFAILLTIGMAVLFGMLLIAPEL